MSVKIRAVTKPGGATEGPHWHAEDQVLYYVSAIEDNINKYDPATGVNTSTRLDGHVSFIIPLEGATDQFVVSRERKFLVVQWDGKDGSPVKVLQELGEVDTDVSPKTFFNDGKADPRGRIFAGSMGPDTFSGAKLGSVYRLEAGKITKVDEGIMIANGLSWDLTEKAFYYTDSLERNIRRYDYDVETGNISNRRYVFDFEKNGIEGYPDGHTIDTDGNLWIAVFGGYCVVQVDPRSGKLLRKVTLPTKQVASATFGGPNMDVLYVATIGMKFTTDTYSSGELDPSSGSIFEVTGLGVKGQPNRSAKL